MSWQTGITFNSHWPICDHWSEPPFKWDLCSQREQTQNWNIHILHSVFYLFWDSINLSVALWSHKLVCCNSECIHILEKGNNRLVYAWGETTTALCDRSRGVLLVVVHPRFPACCGSAKFPMGHEKYAYVCLYIKGGSECVCMREAGKKAVDTDMRGAEWVLHSVLWSNLF